MQKHDYEECDVLSPSEKETHISELNKFRNSIKSYVLTCYTDVELNALMYYWCNWNIDPILKFHVLLENFGIPALKDIEFILKMPLNDLPLYINEYGPYTLNFSIISWRFKLGK